MLQCWSDAIERACDQACVWVGQPIAAQPCDVNSGAAAPVPENRKVRVLVVDDNADAARSLGRLLSLLGKDVRVALDGQAALAELSEFPADVVLLDLGMHGMDGFETARAIRSRSELKRLPLVALTGWGQDQDKQRTTAAGFSAHLVKPVTIDQVQAAIMDAVSADSGSAG